MAWLVLRMTLLVFRLRGENYGVSAQACQGDDDCYLALKGLLCGIEDKARGGQSRGSQV